jgi:hypothetical protein
LWQRACAEDEAAVDEEVYVLAIVARRNVLRTDSANVSKGEAVVGTLRWAQLHRAASTGGRWGTTHASAAVSLGFLIV